MNNTGNLHKFAAQHKQSAISRRSLLKTATALGLSAPLASFLAANGATALQNGPSGELIVSLPRSLVALDPHGAQSVEESTAVISSSVFDSLVARDPVTKDLVPRLAVSWEPIDETTWEFKLREGVKFHDGSDFTSADVKHSLERVLELKGPLAPLWASVTSIETPDDLTVHFITDGPQGTVPSNAALFFITPAALTDEDGFFEKPVGCGPFKFVSWQHDSQLQLEANPDFWNGAPGVATLTFKDIPEIASRVTALETGEISFTYGLPADQLPNLAGNSELTIAPTPSYGYYFNWFNNSREPFTDVRVRQAMAHALDIDTMVNDLLQGVGRRAEAPIPSTVFGFAAQTPYDYDPEKAKALLKEAGLEDGFQTSVIWNPDSGPQDRELMLSMISNWAAIGVTVESKEMERAAWLESLLALDWDMDFQTNTVRTGDADFTLRRLYTSSANRLGYANADLDKILLDAAATTDQDARAELYAQACKIIWDDAAGIFPFELIENYIYREGVENFIPAPNNVPTFESVTISK